MHCILWEKIRRFGDDPTVAHALSMTTLAYKNVLICWSISNYSIQTQKKMEKENTTHHQVELYYYVQIDSIVQLFPVKLSFHGTTEQLEQAIAECDEEMENTYGRVVMKWE